MTEGEAQDLVDDLVQAVRDYDTLNRPSYRDDYIALRKRVIEAMTLKSPEGTP